MPFNLDINNTLQFKIWCYILFSRRKTVIFFK